MVKELFDKYGIDGKPSKEALAGAVMSVPGFYEDLEAKPEQPQGAIGDLLGTILGPKPAPVPVPVPEPEKKILGMSPMVFALVCLALVLVIVFVVMKVVKK